VCYSAKKEGCLACHKGIELTSPNHDFACIECHGGNTLAKEKGSAHQGMHGDKNPSDPSVWDQGCGRCHPYQLVRLKSSLMFTNIGLTERLAKAWGQPEDKFYATNRLPRPRSRGQRFEGSFHSGPRHAFGRSLQEVLFGLPRGVREKLGLPSSACLGVCCLSFLKERRGDLRGP